MTEQKKTAELYFKWCFTMALHSCHSPCPFDRFWPRTYNSCRIHTKTHSCRSDECLGIAWRLQNRRNRCLREEVDTCGEKSRYVKKRTIQQTCYKRYFAATLTNLAKTDNFAKFANKQGAQAKRSVKTNENRPQFHFFECSHTLSRHGKHSDAVGASAFRSFK